MDDQSDIRPPSPAHSLPDVGPFSSQFNLAASSLPAFQAVDPRVISSPALDEAVTLPSSLTRLPTDNSVECSAMCQSLLGVPGHHSALAPTLHRALSTSPRLEHTGTSDDPQLLGDNGIRHGIDPAEEELFFPWAGSDLAPAVDLSASLPAGQLHQPIRFCTDSLKEGDTVVNSDTLLAKENGQLVNGTRKPVTDRVRFGVRGIAHISSQRNSLSSSISDSQRRLLHLFSRQDSEASAGSLVSRRRGSSSIFGSKLFESLSSCSIASQRVNVVAESPGVYPILASHYSIDCHSHLSKDDILGANGSFEAVQSFVPIGMNGHVSSASCIRANQSFNVPGIPGENLALHRSVSLPSRYHYHSVPAPVVVRTTQGNETKVICEKVQDEEAVDNVSDLRSPVPAAAAANKRKWQQTMPDLVEGPESETLTSHGTNREKLAAAALAIIRGDYNDPGLKETAELTGDTADVIVEDRLERRRYIKNLLVLSASFFFLFTSFLAIRNLQSSLNAIAGLGLYSLSCVYGFLFIGSLFTTTIVQRLGPKRSLAISMIAFSFYNIANFWPRFYTLVPASAVVGFFLAVLWTSHATYVTNIAGGYALLTGAEMKDILSRFHGIFFAFFQTSQISGGLISSLLLTSRGMTDSYMGANVSNESTILMEDLVASNNLSLHFDSINSSSITKRCGSLYCPSVSGNGSHGHHQHIDRGDADQNMVRMLMGIFLVSTIVGLVILVLFLDPLEGMMKKSHATFRNQMTAVFRFFFDRHVICMIGLPFYSLLQSSFMFGEFTKAFVTCALGVHMVGYLMLSVSLSSAVTAYVVGSIQKYVGRMAVIMTAMVIHLVLLIFLFFWYPSKDQLPVFFVVAGLWGAGDGIIVPQIISLIGTLFVSNKEPAFAAHKMCQSLSAFSLFISAPYLCTKVKIFLVGCVLIIAAVGYIILEVMLKIEKHEQPMEVCRVEETEKKATCVVDPVCDDEKSK